MPTLRRSWKRFALAVIGMCWITIAVGQTAPSVSVEINLVQSTLPLLTDLRRLLGFDPKQAIIDNIKSFLTLEQQRSSPLLTDARVMQLFRLGNKEIAQALQPFGFYSPTITPDITQTKDGWEVRYRIDLGPPMQIQSVVIAITGAGEQDEVLQRTVANMRMKQGAPFRHQDYEDDKRDLLRRALDRGYLDSFYTVHSVEVATKENAATIRLTLDTNIRYSLGPVTFSDNTIIAEDMLRRYLPFKQGDPYSPTALFDFQNALYDTDYFAVAEVQSRREMAENNEVPIDVTLTAKDRNRYTAGVGYSTDVGPRGTLGWQQRRINQRGDRFRTELRVSEVKDSFSALYAIPIRNPRTDKVEFSATWNSETQTDREDETYVYGVSRTISRRQNWAETVFLNYQTDAYRLLTDTGHSRFLIPGIIWSYSRADNRIYTWNGLKLSLELRGTHPDLFSDSHFAQILTNGKWITRISEKSRLLLRGEAATTQFGELNTLPPSLRFFAGGDQSVRGYDYKSLSPDSLGGEQLLVGSAEYEWRFTSDWGAAIFTDAGNAMNNWTTPLAKSVGLGVRWYSPVGPLRVDLAQSISDPNLRPAWHIVIGPDL